LELDNRGVNGVQSGCVMIARDESAYAIRTQERLEEHRPRREGAASARPPGYNPPVVAALCEG
jgi:hypothetical protein